MTIPPLCTKCGHPPCPHCRDWCDQLITARTATDDAEEGDTTLCCDGKCTYPEGVEDELDQP